MLPWLVTNWLQQAAKERLYQAVQDEWERQQSTAEARRASPCQAALLFTSDSEWGGLIDRLTDPSHSQGGDFAVCEGELHERLVVAVRCSPQPEKIARCAAAILQAHRPRWVVSAGFCTGLVAELRPGEILVANSLVDGAGQVRELEFALDAQAVRKLPGVQAGRLLSPSGELSTPARRREAAQRYDAAAADGVSAIVAQVCRQARANFLAVRAVCPALEVRSSRAARNLGKQKSTAGMLGAFLGALVDDPKNVADIYQEKEAALMASDRLAKFLDSLVRQLAPQIPQSSDTDPSEP